MPLLLTAERVVGGVQIKGDAGGVLGQVADLFVDEVGFDLAGVGHDPFVAGRGMGVGRRKFEAIEGAFAAEGLAVVLTADAVLAGGSGLAAEAGRERIKAEGVVVVEVFVAQASGHRCAGAASSARGARRSGIPVVGETSGEALEVALAARPTRCRFWAPRAGRSARVHRKLPTNEFWPNIKDKHHFKPSNTIDG